MNCPSCHKSVEVLEKNYGALFTCPQCQAVYFINFEGQPEYSENQEAFVSEVADASNDHQPQNDFTTDAVMDEVAGADPLISSFENPMSALEPSQDFAASLEHQGIPSEFSLVANEISDFGNSDAQIASLNYDIEVAGLDSKEEVSAFKEAIDDNRFGWDVSDIMKKLKNGVVRMEKINPVQAYILSKRIRFLKAEVKWKQNVLA